MKSPLSGNSNLFTLAITVDLLLTVPLVYLLLIRQTEIPKTTAVPVMVVGLLIGTYFLPKESQTYLAWFKTWGLPIVELSVLTFVILKVRSTIGKYKRLKGANPDFFSALKSTCREILPKAVIMPVVTEVSVIYYGFLNWRTRTLQKNEFTYHKESGTPALLGAFIFIIIIETFVLHLLLAKWSIIAAWVLSGLSIYTALQVFGFARSLAKRPISINENSLTLRYGILNEVEIPFSAIQSVELTSHSVERPHFAKLSPLGEMENHNVVISLKKENRLIGLYGMKKRFKVIGLHIDKPKEFKEQIDQLL
ncbi:PH domain-containing protein [Tunicatimonas pelagia]|uniref:PH domain-containing protein n=1 Tax=Tunicatimonas pelagia TaxID=931531 RepID=UPI0026657C72|nr:PH domain-containing protein [Tunicatimonas pelagia]WKN46156.1 PH domain-containing protein [Tunicatimonas pelagia]